MLHTEGWENFCLTPRAFSTSPAAGDPLPMSAGIIHVSLVPAFSSLLINAAQVFKLLTLGSFYFSFHMHEALMISGQSTEQQMRYQTQQHSTDGGCGGQETRLRKDSPFTGCDRFCLLSCSKQEGSTKCVKTLPPVLLHSDLKSSLVLFLK